MGRRSSCQGTSAAWDLLGGGGPSEATGLISERRCRQVTGPKLQGGPSVNKAGHYVNVARNKKKQNKTPTEVNKNQGILKKG